MVARAPCTDQGQFQAKQRALNPIIEIWRIANDSSYQLCQSAFYPFVTCQCELVDGLLWCPFPETILIVPGYVAEQ